MEKEIEIYELVKGVRKELQKILNDPEIQADPLFNLVKLDLELNVVISKVTDKGIKVFIVTAGTKYENHQISKIKLQLEPIITAWKKKAKIKEGRLILTMPLKAKDIQGFKRRLEIERSDTNIRK
jgi:hypothetical protein